MKLLKYTPDSANLDLSVRELTIFKNALLTLLDRLTDYEFQARIRITHQEAITLIQKLEKLIESENILKIKEGIKFEYNELRGVNSSLCNLCYVLSIPDFTNQIGGSEEEVRQLIDSLRPTFEKMDKEKIGIRIGKRLKTVLEGIDFLSVGIPRPSQIRQECWLELGQYQVVFLLFSLKNTTTYSGIQILVIEPTNKKQVLVKSSVQNIPLLNLGYFIAFFNEYIYIVKNNKLIDLYVFSGNQDSQHNIFTCQIVAGKISSQEEGFLTIRFRINIGEAKEDNTNIYFDFQDIVSFKNLLHFTSSIRDYLKKVGTKTLQS